MSPYLNAPWPENSPYKIYLGIIFMGIFSFLVVQMLFPEPDF